MLTRVKKGVITLGDIAFQYISSFCESDAFFFIFIASTSLDVVFSRNVQKSTISTFEYDFFSVNPKRTTPSSLPFSGGFNGVD